jgi:hypothetical protein
LQLVDFECWKMMFTRQFSRHEKATGRLNNKSPFPGHGDPAEDKQADIQANTFAFGVILLEIISGRLPYCKDKGYLVDWVSQSIYVLHQLIPTLILLHKTCGNLLQQSYFRSTMNWTAQKKK